jgi:hypothetical protein
MELKRLLKYFAKHGYPSPETSTIMKYGGYDPDEFLKDLVEELGYDGATEFVGKTLSRLSSGINSEIQIKISDIYGYPGSWANIIIHNFFIDLHESEYDVMVNYGWGDNKFFMEDGTETTLEDMADEVDMGGMSEWQDFLDELLNSANGYITERCGFGIWYQ